MTTHIPRRISEGWLFEDRPAIREVTDDLIAEMREFCLDKWRERAAELGRMAPEDLSSSCKFTSLFVREIVGGYISGNADHQFVMLDDQVVDINADSLDVVGLDDPHFEDFSFLGNPEHIDSLESCIPRVNQWLSEFSPAPDTNIRP